MTPKATGAMRLLVVDDDAGFRQTVRHLLSQRDGAAIGGEAADGEEALRMAGALHPDVVLLDLTMPRMNGLEAARHLKAQWPNLVVIILTVYDDEAYRRTALAAGAEAFLVKKTLGMDFWPTLLRLVTKGRQGPARPGPAGGRRRRAGIGGRRGAPARRFWWTRGAQLG